MALTHVNYPNDCLGMSQRLFPGLVKTRQWRHRIVIKFPAKLYKPAGPLFKRPRIILPKEKFFFSFCFCSSIPL